MMLVPNRLLQYALCSITSCDVVIVTLVKAHNFLDFRSHKLLNRQRGNRTKKD